jgi:hypothetical protein
MRGSRTVRFPHVHAAVSTRSWRAELWIVAALLLLGAALRIVMAWRFRVASDEPQHLHVVWAWVRGALPYRDVFDNHMPLFHLLSAPALLVVGERPTAVLWMRLLMLPQWGAALLVTALIGRRLFSPRVGAWSAVLAGFCPLFFFCSLEYRPDVLWTGLWLLAVLIAIGGAPTARRGFVLGVVLGTAAAVSLKTMLMLLAFGIAAPLTVWLAPAGRRPWRRALSSGAAAAAGCVLAPGLVAAFFLARGAFGAFLYGTVWHNASPTFETGDRAAVRIVATALMILGTYGARSIVRQAASLELGLRRAFVLLVVVTYAALLIGLWPLWSRQDDLPAIPLVAILVTGGLVALRRPSGTILIALATGIEVAAVVLNGSVRLREADRAVAFETDVLRLVHAGEPVLDPKGDTVFRRRPIYWVLEGVTKARMRGGLLADDFAGRLVATHTRVVAGNVENLPPSTRQWVRAHYLRVARYPRVGGVLVAGLRFDAVRGGFEVGIPAEYVIVEPSGVPHGVLDGRPYEGPRYLRPGFHSYRAPSGESRVALLWRSAAERTFSPFDAEGNWR